jgi:septum site-determining protein MinC
MKIIIYDTSQNLEITCFDNQGNIVENLKKFPLIKCDLEVKFFAIDEKVNSHQLSNLKKVFENLNIYSLRLYSNDRDTIIAGKSLKIDSIYLKEKELRAQFILHDSKKKDDLLHEGTVRSGDRISSNGNLCIIGDVNPGAFISAKKNIYVWGKLLGIAFAGMGGNKNASISSLYLNPLQLRIADVVAIGPKDKPKNYYPEIAVVDEQTINIKPFIIESKN